MNRYNPGTHASGRRRCAGTIAQSCALLVALTGCAADAAGGESHDHGDTRALALEANTTLNPEYIGIDQARRKTRVRKNVKQLSKSDRERYVDAVLKLKKVPSPYDSSL